jgi:hypothetical protein
MIVLWLYKRMSLLLDLHIEAFKDTAALHLQLTFQKTVQKKQLNAYMCVYKYIIHIEQEAG